MERRDFSKLVGALPACSQAAAQSSKRIKTAMITGGGAHLNYYFESLALAKTSGPFHLTAIAFAPGALAPALT